MKEHHPLIIAREGLVCSCHINPDVICNFNNPPWSTDHLLAKLKEAHYGSQEAKPADTAQRRKGDAPSTG